MPHRTHRLDLFRVALLTLFLTGLCPAMAERTREAGDLTGPWQLFIDDSVVEGKSGVTRRYHAFRKHPANPVLRPDQPWEGKVAYVYGTVLPGEQGSGYRMWYQSWAAGEYRTLYATSRDGLNWEKPALGLVDFAGSRENNLLLPGTQPWHQPQVIWNQAEKDPARRYALISYDYASSKPGRSVSGFRLAYSADGINWREPAPGPVLADPGDVGTFTWDAHTKKFLGYTKIFAPVNGYRRRAIGYTTTTDLQKWNPAELILVPDKFDDRWVTQDRHHTDFYGLSAFPYESGYVGLLWIFRITDGIKDGPIFVELVSSRDGVNWNRQEGDRPPVLALGAEGAWDAGMVFTPNHPLLEGDTLKLYYGGFATTHGANEAVGAIGLATLRKDGFASLDAGDGVGIITTKPLRNARGELRINALASAGWVKAELLDHQGRVLPGYGLADCLGANGDGIDQPITWRQQARLPEKSDGMTIRFSLRNSALFSFYAGERLEIAPRDEAPLEMLTFTEEAGRSRVHLHGTAAIETGYRPGSKSLILKSPGDFAEVPGTARLGAYFTLAARVKTSRAPLARIFSTYRGVGDFVAGELVLDINPRSGVLRFIVNGQRVQSTPRFCSDKDYHHYAAVYANGQVTLYLDGVMVGSGFIRQGTAHLFNSESVIEHFGPPEARSNVGIHLAGDLRIGGDQGGRFMTNQEVAKVPAGATLIGSIDDVLIVRRPLSAVEIQAMAK
jgi:hypothetical protein